MTILYIIIGIVVLLVLYVLATYNGFVRLNNIVKEAFSTMDVYLKKRWDLVPNLVEIVKGYASHEQETFNQLTKLRTESYDNMSMDEKLNVNKELSQGITKVMAIAENYPDLKASQNFLDLSGQLSSIENDIANSRKYYNGTVRTFNTKVQMFPSNIVANMFHFKEANLFEVGSAEERENVKVDFKNE